MTTFAIEYDWQPAGDVRLDPRSPLFPTLAVAPGVYRFWIAGPGDAPSV